MEKIKLEICCGTTCYMLGAAKLLKIEEKLPENWKGMIEVSAMPCLDECESDKLCGAPYVRINGKIMEKASIEKIFDALQSLIKETR